jgi:hypothetical protein
MDAVDRNKGLFVADAIRSIFGINMPIYIPWGKNVPYEADEYPNLQLLQERDEKDDTSEFGTPVFGTMLFEGGEYNMYERKDGSIRKSRFGDYTLPYSCIAEFNRTKNITKTEVLGGVGTVKELYGLGDWDITIRGIAIENRNGTGTTAREQIETLCRWAEVCDTIGIQGSIFGGKGIYSVVINSISVQPIVGRWNAIPFQIELVSDEPIELYLQ